MHPSYQIVFFQKEQIILKSVHSFCIYYFWPILLKVSSFLCFLVFLGTNFRTFLLFMMISCRDFCTSVKCYQYRNKTTFTGFNYHRFLVTKRSLKRRMFEQLRLIFRKLAKSKPFFLAVWQLFVKILSCNCKIKLFVLNVVFLY